MELGPPPPPPPNPNPNLNTQPPPEKPPDTGNTYPPEGNHPKSSEPSLAEEADTGKTPDPRHSTPVEDKARNHSPHTGKDRSTNQTPAERDTSLGFLSYTPKYLTIIQKGFLSQQTPGFLDASEWAQLSCHLVNTIGRGLLQASSNVGEDAMEEVIAKSPDPDPLRPNLPTYFHRLTDTSNLLAAHLTGNLTNYQDEHSDTLEEYRRKAAKKATVEVEETWRLWKEQQLRRWDLLSPQNTPLIAHR
ncbi:hypothetical protein F5148DRAFT_1150835 [Russula earlei]|uniref:Uncharacterized protein n=1 Tax=Russula earlei TaxID=71964 RepID=A0ACC0U3C5_9AGAM|nr:hypothetical protein F5148DRAFT_1150835 [Russula earlei]